MVAHSPDRRGHLLCLAPGRLRLLARLADGLIA